MRLNLLWISLVASVAIAMGLVKLFLYLGLKEQLSLFIPLIPLLNAALFPAVEKLLKLNKPPTEFVYPVYRSPFDKPPKRWSGKLTPFLAAVAASLAMNLILDAAAYCGHYYFVISDGLPFMPEATWQNLVRWLRGDFISLDGTARIAYLTIELLIVSAIGGLTAGLLSRENPVPVGLLTGIVMAMWMGSNQYTAVNETFSNLSLQAVNLAGRLTGAHRRWEWHYGLALSLLAQIFLFAFWSGLGFRLRYRLAPEPPPRKRRP